MSWQQIETAPKRAVVWLIEDGQPLGLTVPHQFQGYWQNDRRYLAGGYWREVGDDISVSNPTHWMPLPPAPEVQS